MQPQPVEMRDVLVHTPYASRVPIPLIWEAAAHAVRDLPESWPPHVDPATVEEPMVPLRIKNFGRALNVYCRYLLRRKERRAVISHLYRLMKQHLDRIWAQRKWFSPGRLGELANTILQDLGRSIGQAFLDGSDLPDKSPKGLSVRKLTLRNGIKRIYFAIYALRDGIPFILALQSGAEFNRRRHRPRLEPAEHQRRPYDQGKLRLKYGY